MYYSACQNTLCQSCFGCKPDRFSRAVVEYYITGEKSGDIM